MTCRLHTRMSLATKYDPRVKEIWACIHLNFLRVMLQGCVLRVIWVMVALSSILPRINELIYIILIDRASRCRYLVYWEAVITYWSW